MAASSAVNVGLIGYGMAGRVFHAPVMQAVEGLRLKKVLERHAEESRKRYPSVEVVRDVRALLDDEEIELVVVATPNRSHFDLAAQALRAGKHVVVEKPFTLTAAEADELIELARRQNRIISPHQNRRWDGDFRTVRQVLESGVLGRLVEYESHFDRYRHEPKPDAWREEDGAGSGILYDLGSHLIDQALVLFGQPRTVRGDVRIQRETARAVDNFELVLDYDKLKVTLKAGMLVRRSGPRFTLHGTLGSFVKYGLDPQEEALKRGGTPLSADWGREPAEAWGTIDTEVGGLHVVGRVETLAGSYQSYYQNILDAVRGRADLSVRPEEARDTARIIELALESSAERCALPFS